MSNIEDLLKALAGGQAQDAQPTEPDPSAAPRERVMDLIEGALQPLAVGDIVVWRSADLQTHSIPAMDEQVIVTNVFQPMRFQEGDAPPATVAVALLRFCACGMADCRKNNTLMELHLDGRRLRKVGTVLS